MQFCNILLKASKFFTGTVLTSFCLAAVFGRLFMQAEETLVTKILCEMVHNFSNDKTLILTFIIQI
jgi:hypothetical protein